MRPCYALLFGSLALAAPRSSVPAVESIAAAAVAAAGNNPFSLTTLSASGYNASVKADAKEYNTLTFQVHDPDPKGNATTKCTLRWLASSQPSEAYTACDDASFNARVGFSPTTGGSGGDKPWKGPSEFGLSVSHGVRDDSMGPPPYNHRRTFVGGSVNAAAVECKAVASKSMQQACRLRAGKRVDMSVVGVSG